MFNVSRRTIYNDLEKINDWLAGHGIDEIRQVYRKGLYLEDTCKKQIGRLMTLSGKTYYEFSQREREAWIFLYLSGGEGAYFLEDFQHLFRVSKNTALEDIRRLKEILRADHGLEIVHEKKNGYVLKGLEPELRRVTVFYLTEIMAGYVSLPEIIVKLNRQERREEEIYSLFDEKKLVDIQEALIIYEKKVGVEFTDEIFNGLALQFFLFVQRMKKGNHVVIDEDEKSAIESRSEFKSALELCDFLSEKLGFSIPEDETYYILKYLLSSKVNHRTSQQLESKETLDLLRAAEQMVDDFQLHAAVIFSHREQVVKDLLLHLKPAFYRIKYGLRTENKLLSPVKENYPEVFQIAKQVMHPFEALTGSTAPEEETAFVAMHFGGWMKKEGLVVETRRRLLVVCTTGLGTARMLESQLAGLFTNTKIIGAISLREYERHALNCDFIVSTISLKDRGVPVFVVNPIISNEDRELLLRQVNEINEIESKRENIHVETLMDLIGRYASIQEDKEKELRQELRKYFTNPNYVAVANKPHKPDFSDLLPPERVAVLDRAPNWEEAVEIAARPLLEQGYIENEYIEKMIQAIHEKGPYVVISEDLAMPHAGVENVKKTGMSMLLLLEPTDMLGKSVRLFVVLATEDNETHLKGLSQFTGLFTDKEKKKKVMATRSKEELVHALHHEPIQQKQ